VDDAPALPPDIARSLEAFVADAKAAFGEDFVSAVLFGSAAEGRLRAASDVNVMLVLARLDPARLDALREPLRTAHALVRLEAMIVLESELADAAEAFAVKFADIAARHRVLAGRDVIRGLAPTRAAMRHRLRQVLLNFILRTRERYALTSLRDEQVPRLVADCAAPLRTAAEILLALEDRPAPSPREALETLARELGGERWKGALAAMSTARETLALPPGEGGPAVIALLELAHALRERARALAD